LTEGWVFLLLAIWFAALSRAAFYQVGLIGEGPVVRLLRRMPLVIVISLAGFNVDREAFKSSTGAMGAVHSLLAVAFAVAGIGVLVEAISSWI